MKYEFDPTDRFIRVEPDLVGSREHVTVTAALDTGASVSVVPFKVLELAGGEQVVGEWCLVNTAGGAVSARRAILRSVSALGVTRSDFPVLTIELPDGLGVDALLGNDFLQKTIVTLDFQNGYIEVTQ